MQDIQRPAVEGVQTEIAVAFISQTLDRLDLSDIADKRRTASQLTAGLEQLTHRIPLLVPDDARQNRHQFDPCLQDFFRPFGMRRDLPCRQIDRPQRQTLHAGCDLRHRTRLHRVSRKRSAGRCRLTHRRRAGLKRRQCRTAFLQRLERLAPQCIQRPRRNAQSVLQTDIHVFRREHRAAGLTQRTGDVLFGRRTAEGALRRLSLYGHAVRTGHRRQHKRPIRLGGQRKRDRHGLSGFVVPIGLCRAVIQRFQLGRRCLRAHAEHRRSGLSLIISLCKAVARKHAAQVVQFLLRRHAVFTQN